MSGFLIPSWCYNNINKIFSYVPISAVVSGCRNRQPDFYKTLVIIKINIIPKTVMPTVLIDEFLLCASGKISDTPM